MTIAMAIKNKQVNSSYGSMKVEVPQDRNSTFEPQVVKKRQKDISDIDQKIISMYAKGMTTRQISETLEDIYGFEASEGFISDVTDKLLPQIEDWQNRPLSDVYPVLYIDAIHYSVRDNGVIRKLAAYVVLGINSDGLKEVLTIEVGENESAKYWLSVLNGLKNRGVKDILILCADGLTGIKEAIATAFPKTEYQRCHCPLGAEYVKIRIRQGQNDLPGANRREGIRSLGACHRKMVGKVPEFYEKLAAELERDRPHL